MLSLKIPGFNNVALAYLVLDYNGTLAVDGKLLPGVELRLRALAKHLEISIVTGNTYGDAADHLHDLPCRLTLLPATDQASAKRAFVEALGAERTIAIGNGRNDAAMLKAAAIGVVIAGREGAAVEAMLHADILATDIKDALDMLVRPQRLIASLRA